jgi:hypothetical protein
MSGRKRSASRRARVLRQARDNMKDPLEKFDRTERLEVELLSHFYVASKKRLEHATETAVISASRIARQYESKSHKRVIRGQVIRDSWVDLPLAALRDAGPGCERLLRFSAGNHVLEIVAEKEEQGWQFVARVYESDRISTGYVLRVGRRKIDMSSQGFFHWESKRPPRSLRLESPSKLIDFGKISWRAMRTD